MTSYYKSNQAGRSMIEMLGVLAIIGVLSVGGISGYSKAMAKFKLTKQQDQLSMVLMNIRTAYATSPSYANLDTESAISYNIIPSDMKISDTSAKNAFGGDFKIGTAEDDTHFTITISNIGQEACMSLASSDWGTDGLVAFRVGSTETLSDDDKVSPGSISEAFGKCENGGKYLQWEYY